MGRGVMGKKAECGRKGEGVIRGRMVGQKEVSTETMRERRGGRREERHKPSS